MTSLTRHLRIVTLILSPLFLVTTAASAQTRGRVAAGASVTTVIPTDSDVHTATSVGFQVRLAPRKGWVAAGAFNWFQADVDGTPVGISSKIARVRVRPLMAGIGYTWLTGPTAVTASVVAGPSWNRLELTNATATGVQIVGSSTDTTLAVRPGVSLTYAFQPRVALTAFAGYLINRPRFTLSAGGGDVRTPWKTDAAVFSVGLVYSFF